VNLEKCCVARAPYQKAKELFESLDFKTLLKQIDTLQDLVEPQEQSQQSMF